MSLHIVFHGLPSYSESVYKGNPKEGSRLPRSRALLALILVLLVAPGAAAPYSIDAVKAAYLFRFASYVEWPASTADAPFVFGVLGAQDVGVHLERLTTGMRVRGRAAQVRQVRTPADLEGLQVLYVGPRWFHGSRALRGASAKKPILLVTDHEDGLAGGAIINFIETERNVRFEISLRAADRGGLRIDSALLSVAARVETRKQE
jgi:hypothetical protein